MPMKVIRDIGEMQSLAIQLRGQGHVLGLVATMGALHEGHLSLVDHCREKVDIVVLSIFVNPIQFGPNEDLQKYPRPMEEDLACCRARGVDIVFAPDATAILPADFSTYVEEGTVAKGLCGRSRPGHFRGVTTIVNILFNVTRPDLAVFGRKDAQQVAVIRKMVRDLHIPVEVVAAPTVRDASGLALSSRNRYLDPTRLQQAAAFPRALAVGKEMAAQGVLSVDRIKAEVTHHLSQSRMIRIIYIDVVDRDSMQPEREVRPGHSLLVAAVWLDQTRLIDNLEL